MSETYVAFDPAGSRGDFAVGIIASIDHRCVMTIHDEFKIKPKKGEQMNESVVRMRKYRDNEGNVYGVERAVRNGHWVVIRTNDGGNRKGAKQFAAAGHAAPVQRLLDSAAATNGWTEVAG